MIILVRWFGKFFGINITTFISSFKRARAFLRFTQSGVLCAVFFLYSETTYAGFERTAQPSKIFGRGLSALFAGDVESLLLNPSTIASLHSLHASIFYSPSPFDLPQLSNGGVLVASPFESFNAAVAVTSTGFSLYRELTATATIAKSFGEKFFAGCNVNYNHLTIANYGSAFTIGIDIAAAVQLVDDVRWGFSLLNVNRPTIGKLKDELPQLYLTGVSYQFLSSADISLDLVKDVRYPASVRVGVQFSPHEIVDVRLGVSTEPSRYCAGIGIHYTTMSFDYGVTTHVELGLTHSFGISFEM